jgi:hypothetical protein
MRPQNLTRGRRGILKMKLQGSGLFHPKTLQSQNCQSAENRLSLNGLEFVHGQLKQHRPAQNKTKLGHTSNADFARAQAISAKLNNFARVDAATSMRRGLRQPGRLRLRNHSTRVE